MFITKIASLTILLAILSCSGGSNALCRCRKGIGIKRKAPSSVAFYYHNILYETNANQVPSNNGFGSTVVFDDPLTVGPTLNSTVVGRAQGVYTSSYDQLGDFFVAWFAFTAFVESPHLNGSLTLVGAAGGMHQRRQHMPVVGGTGDFAFATGVANVRTDTAGSNGTFRRLFFNIELFY
ncbi:hypothetical protein SUGI_1077000 [Cryptomeria japonica]|nr:hypothetical protein SUGI_1077000 [Cryptomeria japonica]